MLRDRLLTRLSLASLISISVVGCAEVDYRQSQDDQATPGQTGEAAGKHPLVGSAERAGYPDDWLVESVEVASASVDFPVIVPDFGPARTETLQAVYVIPTGAVVMDYEPPVNEPASYVRQEYIEVYQAPWLEDAAPEDVYKAAIQASNSSSKSLMIIGGVTALLVEPHSKDDLEQANPAFCASRDRRDRGSDFRWRRPRSDHRHR